MHLAVLPNICTINSKKLQVKNKKIFWYAAERQGELDTVKNMHGLHKNLIFAHRQIHNSHTFRTGRIAWPRCILHLCRTAQL